jgi:hypothetical protein
MGVSPTLFSLVKTGERTARPRFRRQAVHALILLEQVKPDGQPFEEADLFLPPNVPTRTETVPMSEVA